MSRTNYNCLSFMAIKCLHKFTLPTNGRSMTLLPFVRYRVSLLFPQRVYSLLQHF